MGGYESRSRIDFCNRFDGRLIRVDHAQDNRQAGIGRGTGVAGRGGHTMPMPAPGGYQQPGTQARNPNATGPGRGAAYPQYGQYNPQYQQPGGSYGGEGQPQGGSNPYSQQGPYRQ